MSFPSPHSRPGPTGGPGVLGPWSEWPRRDDKRPMTPDTKPIPTEAGMGIAAIYRHCVLPLL